MSHENIDGQPVQIISIDETTGTFRMNDEALKSILMRDDVIDRKIAVISVVGAFRKGKSFLLNFFLRYLQYEGNKVSGNVYPSLERLYPY